MRIFAISTISILCLAGISTAQNAGLQFVNGLGDTHVDVPYAAGLLPRSGMTLEAWIRYDDATMPAGQGWRWPTIARQDVAAGGESYFLRVGAGQSNSLNLEWAVHNGSSLQFTVYTFSPGEFAQWTHVAAVLDADARTSTIYINGQLKATGTATGPLRDNKGLLRIGNGDVSTPGYEVWHGDLDELRIWPFPRTQKEIVSTMKTELLAIPGGISFNFNTAPYIDSSSGFQGAVTGTIATSVGPALTPTVLGSTSFGVATTTCAGRVEVSTTSMTAIGNADFAFQLYEVPATTGGAIFLALGSLPTPIPFLGVQLNVNPGLFLPSGVSVTSSASGMVRVPWAIPSDPGIVGLSLYAQGIFIDQTCGFAPFNLVGSKGLEVKLQ